MCPGCREAESNPMTHVLYMNCDSCSARAIAVSHIYEKSAAAGAMTKEYRKSLGQVFGERWKEGQEMVKKWAGRMKETQT